LAAVQCSTYHEGEEARHHDPTFDRYRVNHQVRGVAYIGKGTHAARAQRNRRERAGERSYQLLGVPPASSKSIRYVGALSRKPESIPLSQKRARFCAVPPSEASANIQAKQPRGPALNIASIGMMQMKMPANSLSEQN